MHGLHDLHSVYRIGLRSRDIPAGFFRWNAIRVFPYAEEPSEWCAQLNRPGMPDRYDLERKWYEHYFGVQ
jgi:hypothetical protein